MKFSRIPVFPNCAPLISTTCSQGWLGLSASIMARWYGTRSVRHSPRSAADSELNRRFSPAHWDTVMSGGGSTTSATSIWISTTRILDVGVDCLQKGIHLALHGVAYLALIREGGHLRR